MLVTLKEILAYAEKNRCAIGGFNGPNLASLRAVLQAAEITQTPIILMHAQVHESLVPLDLIGPIMVHAAKAASVPVCVHLDHGEDIAYLKRAAAFGFTGVMYDGSLLPYEENLANTQEVVAFMKPLGISVEAEIGAMGSRENGGGEGSAAVYTDAGQALDFVKATGIDALACSFGTAHGLYLKKPQLDFTVLDRVRSLMPGLPLVMHGGSGVSDEDYHQAIQRGIRKINYYTYMAKAGGEATRKWVTDHQGQVLLYHDIATCAMEAMQLDIEKAIRLFAAG